MPSQSRKLQTGDKGKETAGPVWPGQRKMIYSPLTKKALNICYRAHQGQMDHGGMPYVFHPVHVAESMSPEEETCTALLHDVLEDTSMGLGDLRREGIPDQVLEALSLLKHDLTVPYMEYVLLIRQNALARTVKLADLAHNSELGRLEKVTPYDRRRRMKYLIAAALLKDLDVDESTGNLSRRIPLDQIGLNRVIMYYRAEGDVTGGRFELPERPEKQFIITAEGLEQWKASFISGGRSLPERYADRLEKIGSEFFARELVEKGLAKAAEKE